MECAVFIPVSFLEDHEWIIDHRNRISRAVTLEPNPVLAVDVPEHQRTDLAFSSAVVGNKKAEIRIRYQVQVAMEILSVAAMSDDAMPISFLFIEAECHGIHVG